MQNLLATLFLLCPAAFAELREAKPTDWVLTDISMIPELNAFFGNADALIAVREGKRSEANEINPTILLYKLQDKPAIQLKTAQEWQNLLRQYIKDPNKIDLAQAGPKNGRFVLEFTSRNKSSSTDLRSLYMGIQRPDNSVILLIYEGSGSASVRNLPLVRSFYNQLDIPLLRKMYQEDIERRKNLRPATAI